MIGTSSPRIVWAPIPWLPSSRWRLALVNVGGEKVLGSEHPREIVPRLGLFQQAPDVLCTGILGFLYGHLSSFMKADLKPPGP